jgi:lysophospholipase L1-like esterase
MNDDMPKVGGRIREKLMQDYTGLCTNGPITIVAFGDSVTHGAFESGTFDYESVYWNRLKKKLHAVRSYTPVNVINAGIGGITAKDSLARMDKQVLAHDPDLVIVNFGLNDVHRPLEEYLGALGEIFRRCQAAGTDVIFLTPNMMNTYVGEAVAPKHLKTAQRTAEIQNSGRFDRYIAAAIALAGDMDVTVCDCYALWKERSKTEDTTKLLANGINHPIREMHELFAEELFRAIFGRGSE